MITRALLTIAAATNGALLVLQLIEVHSIYLPGEER